MTNIKEYEVIIIGGSYAGLSAAMALGRSLRNVALVVDSGLPATGKILIRIFYYTRRRKPAAIASKQEKVLRYQTVTFLDDLATSGRKSKWIFNHDNKKGQDLFGKKHIFASGIKD
jgi:thioredoxin reductase